MQYIASGTLEAETLGKDENVSYLIISALVELPLSKYINQNAKLG